METDHGLESHPDRLEEQGIQLGYKASVLSTTPWQLLTFDAMPDLKSQIVTQFMWLILSFTCCRYS